MVKRKFYVPIYDHYIHVMVENEIEECSAHVSFSEENKALYVVFDKNKMTPSLIVHETVHIVNRLFIFKGVELDAKNDETQAYLTEYVFDKLTEITEKLILARDL